VLNVQEKTLEDYREPSADGFQSKQTLRPGQKFNLVAFAEIFLDVSDFCRSKNNSHFKNFESKALGKSSLI
jgi:hypothetical protein